MITVGELMKEKDKQGTISISPEATVYEALQLMADKDVGALMVVKGGEMIGILTERDYARKVILQKKSSFETSVGEIMTSDTITVRPEQTIEEAMQLMSKYQIRHLPVMEKGRLVGMVSMRDVVEAIISMKDSDIAKLENYILSEGYGR
jgi:CBS domain-containing protein